MSLTYKTLPVLKDELPFYSLRVWVGGIYFTAKWEDFSDQELNKFRGKIVIDHDCNEIDLSNKD